MVGFSRLAVEECSYLPIVHEGIGIEIFNVGSIASDGAPWQ